MNLKDKRAQWEKSLIICCVIDQTNHHGRVLVVLDDMKGKYHCHRYVYLGDDNWDVSVDHQSVMIEMVWRWLNKKAGEKGGQ